MPFILTHASMYLIPTQNLIQNLIKKASGEGNICQEKSLQDHHLVYVSVKIKWNG